MIMKQDDNCQYEYFSSVRQRKVEWLWYPYIAYGKLTILQGDPGEGKSTFMLHIAALLSRGKPMPDGYRVPEPQQIIYQTAEDNISDTVKPRLLKADADCNKIAYIIDEEASLTLEDSRIEKVIAQTKARLFILDPLQAYLSQDSDMYSAGRMRQQLKKLADIAAKYKCAVVIIGHMNKTSTEKNLYRGLGSIDITAIARSVLMITRDKDDQSIRYMFPVKSSLAPEGKTIGFRFDRKRGLDWLGYCELDTEEEDSSVKKLNKRDVAEKFMIDMLEEEDVLGSVILNKLQVLGISARTVNKVKSKLGVSSYRKDGVWYWHLDEPISN